MPLQWFAWTLRWSYKVSLIARWHSPVVVALTGPVMGINPHVGPSCLLGLGMVACRGHDWLSVE